MMTTITDTLRLISRYKANRDFEAVPVIESIEICEAEENESR